MKVMANRVILKSKLVKGHQCHIPQNALAILLCKMAGRPYLGVKWFAELRRAGFSVEVLDEE